MGGLSVTTDVTLQLYVSLAVLRKGFSILRSFGHRSSSNTYYPENKTGHRLVDMIPQWGHYVRYSNHPERG